MTTRLSSKIIFSPVAGFLPFRGAFPLTWNFPNPDIMTSSPDSNEDFTISSNVSKWSWTFCGEDSSSSSIFSISAALVKVKRFYSTCFLLLVLCKKTSRASIFGTDARPSLSGHTCKHLLKNIQIYNKINTGIKEGRW